MCLRLVLAMAFTLQFSSACSVLVGIFEADVAEDGYSAGVDAGEVRCYKIDPGCPQGWQSFRGSCSCYLGGLRGTPAEGYDTCRVSHGAHLLAIESSDEQSAVQSHLDGGGTDFALGLFHDGVAWQWDTGESLASTGFSALEDTGTLPDGEPCVEFEQDRGGRWQPYECTTNDIVCELDGKQARLSPP